MEKKLFIFDVGGVVINDTPIIEEFCEKYGLDFKEVFPSWIAYNKPMMDGFMGSDALYAMYEAKFGIRLNGDDVLLSCYHPITNPVIRDLVCRLRSRGYRVVAGSNTYSGHWDFLKDMDPSPLDVFDRLYASHEMHLSKPDRQFFEYILKAEGTKASEAVFVDDSKMNIEGAQSVGLDTFRYHGNNDELAEFMETYLR